MENVLYVIGVIVAIEGLFKAIEYGINKITSQHDKVQKIDSNAESLEDYKQKADAKLDELDKKVNDAHKYALDTLNNLEKSITKTLEDNNKVCVDTLEEHKKEYVQRISKVENSITETQAVYQQTIAIFDVKLDALTTQVEKHNSVIERTYTLEKAMEVVKEKQSVANHRLSDVEDAMKECSRNRKISYEEKV